MTSAIEFKLASGECNGYMVTRWYANDELFYESAQDQEPGPVIESQIDLPCTIRIEISGKDMMNDTKVEGDKIVADKFIELQSMTLSKIPVYDHNFVKILEYQTEDGRLLKQRYISWNGEIKIELNDPDPLRWHLCYNPVFAE